MHSHTHESHTFTAALECRYLLLAPEHLNQESVLVLALHGYGSNPETMLRLSLGLLGSQHIIASLQGPNHHYKDILAASAEPAYNWGIRQHWESALRLHHEIVRHALGDLRERFRIPARRCLLVGFSQPVGLNYRFVGTHPQEVGGVIGICGGVPRDWEEEGKYQRVSAPILHISRDEDEFYPLETVAGFADRLRRHAADVEHHIIPGKHRFPSKASSIVRPWMARVFGAAERAPHRETIGL